MPSSSRRGSALTAFEGLGRSDPLIAVARALPPLSPNVRGADEVLAAGASLLDAVGDGLAIGRRYVEIRDSRAGTPGDGSALAQLVELLATSRDEACDAASTSVADARQRAGGSSGRGDRADPGRSATRCPRGSSGTPMLDCSWTPATGCPRSSGWNEPRRYLVLTQDPAELRPTGGFIGSYGIIVFDRGSITDYSFHDVSPVGLPVGLPAHRATAGAGGLPARRNAALAVRGRELVARLPDKCRGRAAAVRERIGRRIDSTA